MQKKIKVSKSCVDLNEIRAVENVLREEYLGMGAYVARFELEIKEFLGSDSEVICVNTGTSALHMALSAIGIGYGDEVLVPSITYVASIQAISATGATPVLCDVTHDKCFIDINDARKRITKRTKAIMPVHYASDASQMPQLREFAKEFSLRVIEDAAHSFGSLDGNKLVGAMPDILCFSFDGIKNITAGEGGAIITADMALAERLKDIRLLGVHKDTEKRYAGERSWDFDVENQGFRYHMSNIMAAIGSEQLKKFPIFKKRRQDISNIYISKLSGLEDLKLFDYQYNSNVPHIFPVKILNDKRTKCMNVLKLNNIETGVHYKPNHLLSYYKTDYKLPAAEVLYTQILSLPIHPDLTDEDINFVCDLLIDALRS